MVARDVVAFLQEISYNPVSIWVRFPAPPDKSGLKMQVVRIHCSIKSSFDVGFKRLVEEEIVRIFFTRAQILETKSLA